MALQESVAQITVLLSSCFSLGTVVYHMCQWTLFGLNAYWLEYMYNLFKMISSWFTQMDGRSSQIHTIIETAYYL